MKVFIDIGGHTGQSIERFYEEIDDANDWRIYTFEPIYFNSLINHVSKYSNVKFINGVAGIIDGKITIYPVAFGGQGSTVLMGKTTCHVDYKNGKQVKSIDFIKWFRHNINIKDFVIVKMNIEGGEYILMPRLPEIMSQIKGLYIKLHHHKFNAVKKSKLIRVYEKFKIEIQRYDTFVFCDILDKPYRFEWMVSKAYEKQR